MSAIKKIMARSTIYRRNKQILDQYSMLFPNDPSFAFLPPGLLQKLPSRRKRVSFISHDLECDGSEDDVEPTMQISPPEAEREDTSMISDESNIAEFMDYSSLEKPTETEDIGSSHHHDDDDNCDVNHSDNNDSNDSDNNDGNCNESNNSDDNEGSIDDNEDRRNEVERFFSFSKALSQIPLISRPGFHENDYLLGVIAMSVRCNFTYEATLYILKFANITHETSFPTTKAALWKALNRDESIVTPHFYCHECKADVGVKDESMKECACRACTPNTRSKTIRYFLEINLQYQIVELLNIPGIEESLMCCIKPINQQKKIIKDLYDGEVYLQHCQPGGFLDNPYNFSLTMNTDGCKVSNSSAISAWPVYFQVNELPPHVRKKHMLLAGIFVDSKHPLMNNYLRPIIDQIRVIYEKGVEWTNKENINVTSRFIVTTCTVDSPARALITRTKQFNGYYGCSFCYQKGKRVSKKHVFPIRKKTSLLRTHAEMKNLMISAYKTKKPIMGVKGISSLMALPEFDFCKGMAVDGLHAVFLGAVKQHMSLLWTTTGTDFYIGSPKTKKKIDERLLSIKPPTRRARLPRSINTFNQWKGSELRNWLDYSLLCLEGILPMKYIRHIALLSQSIHYLNSDRIEVEELDDAADLLKQYVQSFQDYFGVENMSFNIHLLTHLVNTVRNLGPIWANSCFTFESWNKKIIDKVTSANSRADQIVSRFLMSKFVELSVFDTSISKETSNFICNMMKIVPATEDVIKVNNWVNIGSCEEKIPTEEEINCLKRSGYASPKVITSFHKVKISGVEYRVRSDNSNKFCNSFVFSENDSFGEIISILKFNDNKNEVCGFAIKCIKVLDCAFGINYIKRVKESDRIVFTNKLKNIKPAMKVCTVNGMYAFKLPNYWETD